LIADGKEKSDQNTHTHTHSQTTQRYIIKKQSSERFIKWIWLPVLKVHGFKFSHFRILEHPNIFIEKGHQLLTKKK